ncbi:hypothetical protein Pmani_026260 [Petrolisthes manimaculis]|uniref:Uncharacterized protein n=1 Tax=Petrolisthes manimaculis TaxID=1843537 RepID=A0AAE1P648_9EUCA|nr:hypothetical protein Pmani_026260 [Petrolisthes manimaculis]
MTIRKTVFENGHRKDPILRKSPKLGNVEDTLQSGEHTKYTYHSPKTKHHWAMWEEWEISDEQPGRSSDASRSSLMQETTTHYNTQDDESVTDPFTRVVMGLMAPTDNL